MIVEISDPDGVIGIKIELPDSGSDASIIESVADNWRNTGEVILTEWVAGEPLGDYEDDSIRRGGAELEDCSLRLAETLTTFTRPPPRIEKLRQKYPEVKVGDANTIRRQIEHYPPSWSPHDIQRPHERIPGALPQRS